MRALIRRRMVMPKLDIISDVSRFLAMESEWNALADRFQNPLLRHEWFVACWHAFGQDKDLAVFTVRDDDGRLRAAAPFLIDRGTLVLKLNALGHESTEPSGFIYADDTALDLVVKAVVHHGLPAMVPRLRSDAPELRALRAATGLRGCWFVLPGNTATATLPLGCDWATLQARMTGEERSKIRRRMKKAERKGPVSFETVIPNEANVHSYLRQFYTVEASGWKSRTGTAILSDARIERLCDEIGERAAKLGILRLFFMRIGDAIVAGLIMLEHGGRLWTLKQGYDERWSDCAPGILVINESVRYACDKGLAAYEFLGSAETWQKRWPIELTPYSRVRFYPLSPRSLLALGEDACRLPFNRMKSNWQSKSGSMSEFIRPANASKENES